MASILITSFALLFLTATSSAQLLLNNFGGSDLTLVSGSSGVDVVDACIQKINSVPGIGVLLKNDFGFLKRLALGESSFGQITGNPQGGIWQITSAMANDLNSISNSALVNSVLNVLSTVFGSDVLDFNSFDFSVPLKSAVAARLYIEIRLQSQAIPGTIDEQANWWKNNYNSNGVVATFVTTVSNYENINRCVVSKLDLWFVIDGSGSIGASHFSDCLNFVNQTAGAFQISSDNVRTGLMIYSSANTVRSYFNQHQSNSQFSAQVLSTPYPEGGTNTGAAITKIDEDGYSVSNGARPEDEGVPRILVILTDGKSNDEVANPARRIQQNGVTVFGVGVGTGFDENEINVIASDPDSQYAYEISQFDSLATVLRDRVAEQACTAPALIPDNIGVSLVVQAQTTVYSQISLPSNGSVELRYEVTVTTSIGIVYLSESVANPNAALHDATFIVSVGVTSVFYNAIGTSSSTNRKKRQTESIATNPLYIAFKSEGTEPINMKFTAATSTTRASGSSVVKRMAVPSILSLALLSLLLS